MPSIHHKHPAPRQMVTVGRIHLVEREGLIRRVAVVHADPTKADVARRLREEYPPRWNNPAGISQVIRTGQPVF
ncbi:MAG TPA: hypothetical protein VFT29_08155, partial [Gemmatimonadaceae bacterium]|nr:hypothetical protein [Gemmatimonadaceae bacterium]